MHQISILPTHPRQLSQAVIQAGDLLGLIRAEVARILGFQCADISNLYQGRLLLSPHTFAWQQAQHFLRFYQQLYILMAGQESRMIHWLRTPQPTLGDSPFYLLIDHGRLEFVLIYLEKRVAGMPSRL